MKGKNLLGELLKLLGVILSLSDLLLHVFLDLVGLLFMLLLGLLFFFLVFLLLLFHLLLLFVTLFLDSLFFLLDVLDLFVLLLILLLSLLDTLALLGDLNLLLADGFFVSSDGHGQAGDLASERLDVTLQVIDLVCALDLV